MVAAKDNCGNPLDPNCPNASLLHLICLVGIDHVCSIDMVGHNVDMIRKMKHHVRVDLLQQKFVNQASDSSPSSPGPIDTSDATFQELCSDNGRSDAEVDGD